MITNTVIFDKKELAVGKVNLSGDMAALYELLIKIAEETEQSQEYDSPNYKINITWTA